MPQISNEIVAPYKYISRFRAGMHHMCIQDRKDPTWQWVPMSYRLTKKDMNLIVNDREEDWKIPTERIGHSNEGEEHDKSDEDIDDE